MPEKLLKRLAGQVGDKGMAIALLKKRGDMQKDSTELTTKGKKREALGPAGRAKDRASKASGHPPGDYSYDKGRNSTKLRR